MLQIHPKLRPIVSIVLPCYNRAEYLTRSVDSVLAQSLDTWELIVVDDGSSDKTPGVVAGYIARNTATRYVRHSHRGLPLSQNVGIQAACGKYVTFLDSDDEYRRDHLALRVQYMEDHPEVDLIHGGLDIVGNPFVKDRNDLSREIHLDQCIVGGTFFGKRRAFLELGGFRTAGYAHDADFFARAYDRLRTARVDYPTYVYYRDTPGSITNTI
jgi:glycosyltransferase involved in cell wall biosynthesis